MWTSLATLSCVWPWRTISWRKPSASSIAFRSSRWTFSISAISAAVESSIEEVKKALESNDPAQISRALESLNASQSKAAEMLYKNASANASSAGNPSAGAPGADPDAFIEVGDVVIRHPDAA